MLRRYNGIALEERAGNLVLVFSSNKGDSASNVAKVCGNDRVLRQGLEMPSDVKKKKKHRSRRRLTVS